MATDFWASSHYKRWIVDRVTLKHARAEDLQYVDDPEHLEFLPIFFANVISKLGKKLGLRQRVIATATVFFRRFYLKNSYCETDPFIVIAACCYVAAKAEESPVHIKNIVSEARTLFNHEAYAVKSFPSDNAKLAEMEFYLVDDLECDLTVFHPYRTLLTLCRKENGNGSTGDTQETEAGEVGVGIGVEDGLRYWGTGEGQLELQEGPLQMAWFIINDTYRSELCLLYPPHLIAIAAIYLTLILHVSTRKTLLSTSASSTPTGGKPQPEQTTPTPQPRRSSRQAHHAPSPELPKKPAATQDAIGFLAELNVSLPLIATISQEIISLYTLWDRYKDDPSHDSAKASFTSGQAASPYPGSGGPSNSSKRSSASRSATLSNSNSGTPAEVREDTEGWDGGNGNEACVTPAFLAGMLVKMREARYADPSHLGSGRPVAINKMLERTQAAG